MYSDYDMNKYSNKRTQEKYIHRYVLASPADVLRLLVVFNSTAASSIVSWNNYE